MHTIRLAAIDLDGTLLHDDMTVSAISREIIQKAAKQIRIVVATGRMFDSARAKANLLGLPDMPVICYTGAWVGMSRSGRILDRDGLPIETAAAILQYGREKGWAMQSYIDDEICLPAPSPAEEKYRKYRAKASIYLGEDFYHPSVSPTRIIIVEADRTKKDQIRREIDETFGDAVEMVYPGDDFLDVHKRGVSKGNAIKKLAASWHISMDETVSFGNTENDASMLEITGLSYAVSNAEPAAKKAAREILPFTNEEDGVARKLAELLGL